MRTPRTILRLLRRLGADARGVAAIEFALVAPILIVLYAGGFEIAQASTVYRKLTDTTVQLANVTSQYTTMSSTDVSNVLNASSQIMSPYSTGPLTVVLSEVETDSSGTTGTVQWSEPFQTTALSTSTKISMPSGFQQPNSYYILAQTTYQYTPVIGSAFISPIAMSSQIFMLPRASSSIPYTG